MAKVRNEVPLLESPASSVATSATSTKVTAPDSLPTYQLLGQWIDLVNENGRHSSEAQSFLAAHADNAEFRRLANISDSVREMLGAGPKFTPRDASGTR
jgi:hypothetical protein